MSTKARANEALQAMSELCSREIASRRSFFNFQSTEHAIDDAEETLCGHIASIRRYMTELERDNARLHRLVVEDAEGDELRGFETEADEHRADLDEIDHDDGGKTSDDPAPASKCTVCSAGKQNVASQA